MIAMAAVRVAHAATGAERDEEEIAPARLPLPRPREAPPMRPGRPKPTMAARGKPRPAVADWDVARLFIGAGREAGIRPADLVGAIANEAGVSSSRLGAIEIRDRFSLVEVPADAAAEIVKAMRRATLRGQKVQVRQDRDDL